MKLIYKVILGLIVFLGILILAYNSKAQHDFTKQTYQVKYGDTLWDIASRYCPNDLDKTEYIDLLIEENGLPSAKIYAGDYIDVLVVKINPNGGWIDG